MTRGTVRFTEQLRGPRCRLDDLVLVVTARRTGDTGFSGQIRSGRLAAGRRIGDVVEGSRVDILAAGEDGTLTMRYLLQVRFPDGVRTVTGLKVVERRQPLRLWRQTTRLVLAGDGIADTVAISPGGFARQLLGMRGRPADLLRFGLAFAGVLARHSVSAAPSAARRPS